MSRCFGRQVARARPDVGKSTAARHLVEYHGFDRRPFAGPLKGMLRALLFGQGVPAENALHMVDGDLKEVPAVALDGATPRRAMQTLGTEWGRALAPELWVNAWRRSLHGIERVVADDVRFENEAEAVRFLGEIVIEVQRPGIARLAGGHASEAGVVADIALMNGGSPDDLAATLSAWLR